MAMNEHLREFEEEKNNEGLISAGRVLYLTKDRDLILRQLAGEKLSNIPEDELRDNI